MDNLLDEDAWMKEYELRSKLSKITNRLSLHEQNSLIFLLCEQPKMGLQTMHSMLQESNITRRNNLFFNWLIKQRVFTNCKSNWEIEFAEYLTVIKHYHSFQILKTDKNIALEKYKPNNKFSQVFVSSLRKLLYNFSESLSYEQTQKLKNALDKKSSSFGLNSDYALHPEFKYLGYKLLKLWDKEIINLGEEQSINLDILISTVKNLGFHDFALDLAVMVDTVKTKCIREIASLQSAAKQSDIYPVINDKNLGFCIIINEKSFSSPSLPTRYGTEKDIERLTEVFTAFGFTVRVHSNLTYLELVIVLDHYAKSIEDDHSVFVLIILSHGSENIIYTSDSSAVDMSTIEMIFQAEICPNLIGKPKIFIVQSCQGEKWQNRCVKSVLKEKAISTDSCIREEEEEKEKEEVPATGPQRGDSIIAWSTVRGFASFRDKYNGSWYVEELCRQLWKFGDILDLVEIFTRVNDGLRKKVYGNQFMVPSLLLSLRAKVKLPCLKENVDKGKKILIKRLLFDKLLLEFTKSDQFLSIMKRVKCFEGLATGSESDIA